LTISLYRDAVAVGPDLIDGDFDNGIIAHEYTHGISSRLTGGRLNSNCLNQGEQSDGEGWSDFLALALTARSTDRGTSLRGIGNFVLRQSTADIGIRRSFYTTDMTQSPWTYDDIIRSPRVHDAGEVWVAPLWDLYWQFVGLYGFDADLKNTNSGNGRMLKLVMDGMKIQPCNPGFLDARDAILAADKANFSGQHECMIWSAFARRGLGFNAKQGLASRYDDNTEGFETRPQCVQKLKITKTANVESVKPGEPITFTITVTNHKAEALSGVVVTDEMPTGLTLISGSATRPVNVASGILTWNIGTMARDTTLTLTYRVNTAADKMSILQFLDDFEKGDINWDLEDPKQAGNIWEVMDAPAKSGKKVAKVTYTNLTVDSDQLFSLNKNIKVTGTKPILRFYHKYNTQPAFDGGMVQISTNNGGSWENIETKFFKNPYRGRLTYDAFAALNLFAFWGKVDTFVASAVDLSSYIGKDIRVRFRFGSDDVTNNFEGWTVDDVAVMDMFNYAGRARVISTQRDTAFAEVPERGIIVDPSVMTSVSDLSDGLSVEIFPNPTQDLLNLHIKGAASNQGTIVIHTADGRIVQQQSVLLSQSTDSILPIDVSALTTGFYFIKIQTDNKIVVKKLVKK
jgi:extracellular elastinolytic metalloproteinase